MLTAGCFCCAIRYEVRGSPFHKTNCHSSICGRTLGAPFVTWFAADGLAQARKQNDRDSEQYFLELSEAARKQGG